MSQRSVSSASQRPGSPAGTTRVSSSNGDGTAARLWRRGEVFRPMAQMGAWPGRAPAAGCGGVGGSGRAAEVVEGDRRGRGDVERVHAVAHRDAGAPRRGGERPWAEAVAFGTEQEGDTTTRRELAKVLCARRGRERHQLEARRA